MRLLSRIQQHRRRDARGKCQLVRHSAMVQSERARGRMKKHILKSVSVQRALAMGRALRRWRGASTWLARLRVRLACEARRSGR